MWYWPPGLLQSFTVLSLSVDEELPFRVPWQGVGMASVHLKCWSCCQWS